jgi:hypothetical protein
MKLLSLTDRIYFYVYSCLMKTKSRNQVHGTSAAFMVAIVLFHTLTILGTITYVYGIQLAHEKSSVIIIVAGALLLYGAWIYYLRTVVSGKDL